MGCSYHSGTREDSLKDVFAVWICMCGLSILVCAGACAQVSTWRPKEDTVALIKFCLNHLRPFIELRAILVASDPPSPLHTVLGFQACVSNA